MDDETSIGARFGDKKVVEQSGLNWDESSAASFDLNNYPPMPNCRVGSWRSEEPESIDSVFTFHNVIPITRSTPTKRSSTTNNHNIAAHCFNAHEAQNSFSNGNKTSENTISSSQQSAIYSIIYKFFGLNVKESNCNSRSCSNGEVDATGDHSSELGTSQSNISSSSSEEIVNSEMNEAEMNEIIENSLQLVLDRLLQIVELPFLENVLEYLNECDGKCQRYQHLLRTRRCSWNGSEESLNGTYGSSNVNNSSPSLLPSSSSSSSSSDSLPPTWAPVKTSSVSSPSFAAASSSSSTKLLRSNFNKLLLACLQSHPHSSLIPKSKVLSSQEKLSWINMVSKHFKDDPLIPRKMRELCFSLGSFAITVTNSNVSDDWERLVDAVFLFVSLIDTACRTRLHSLIRFLEHLIKNEANLPDAQTNFIDNRDLVKCSFSQCLIPDNEAYSCALLFVLIDYRSHIFVPWSNYNMMVLCGYQKKMKRNTFCKQITVQKFAEQKQENTTEELMGLLSYVLSEKSTLTTRQKDKLIKAIQTKHPQVYGLYSMRRVAPSSLSSFNNTDHQ